MNTTKGQLGQRKIMTEKQKTAYTDFQGYFLDEVKTRAEKGSPFFFNPDTMRFFKSRISELCWKVNEEIYFITSEKNTLSDRMWTIRKIDLDGDINTIGKFQEYSSLREARKEIQEILN